MNDGTETDRALAREFPVIDRHTWLNHAAISPWPKTVIDSLQGFVSENAEQGPVGYGRWLDTENRLRQRAAELLRADSAEDVALLSNTTRGLGLIARGLDWRDGDNVVFPDNEFPSNRLPWQALGSRGVVAHAVPCDPDAPEASLIAAIDRRTRLLSVSSVQYDTGCRLDLERLAIACRARGVLLCVDAIQQLGALPLEVDRIDADFVVAGSHKWLLAPEGVALFWSRPAARAQLEVVDPGWRMFPDPFNFGRDDWQPPDSARRFEPGTLNTMGNHGLAASIGLMLDIGPDDIAHRLAERVEHLYTGLLALPGIRVITPARPERRAGIVCFESERLAARELLEHLARHNIFAATRGSAVRLSPHFYTPHAQIDQALRVIAEAG